MNEKARFWLDAIQRIGIPAVALFLIIWFIGSASIRAVDEALIPYIRAAIDIDGQRAAASTETAKALITEINYTTQILHQDLLQIEAAIRSIPRP